MASLRDYFKLHFLVFLWGFTAILGKLVSIPAMEMVFYRTLLAALGTAVVMVFLGRSFTVTIGDKLKVLATGIIVALHWLTFFASGRVANVSVSLIGFATASLWTAFLEPWMKRQRPSLLEILLGCMVILGLAVILSYDFQYKAGLALGIASGFTAALFSVINSRLVSRVSSYAITFYEMTGAFLTLALLLPLYKRFFAVDHALHLSPALLDWVWIAILAWVCSVYTFTEGVNLMKKVSVFLIQLTLNLEPLYGMVLAVLFFQEHQQMNLSFYGGTLIILLAVLLYPFLKKKMT